MRSPLDNNNLSNNYQRHHHSLLYYLQVLFCNARRCWRLSSFLLLLVAGAAMVYLGTIMAKSNDFNDNSGQSLHPVLQGNDSTRQFLKDSNNHRLKAVKDAFIHAWNGYEEYAWGFDELKPVSRTHEDNWFGLGLTAIDSLDTSIIMELPEVTDKIKKYCVNSLKYNHDGLSNVFELTIRILGAFLSGYNMTSDKLYLEKAVEIGDILMLAFENTPTPLPATSINFAVMKGVADHVVSVSEATTIQLEFKYLTFLTKDPKYWNAAQTIMKHVFSLDRPFGLVPYYLSYNSGDFYNNHLRLGSRSDSYYEYLAKQYLQTSFTEPRYQEEWDIAVNGIRQKLLGISSPNNLLFIGERPVGVNGHFSPKMDHLVCFFPGTLAIAATKGKPLSSGIKLSEKEQNDLDLAEELVKACYETYNQTPTGLSPEVVSWNAKTMDIPENYHADNVLDESDIAKRDFKYEAAGKKTNGIKLDSKKANEKKHYARDPAGKKSRGDDDNVRDESVSDIRRHESEPAAKMASEKKTYALKADEKKIEDAGVEILQKHLLSKNNSSKATISRHTVPIEAHKMVDFTISNGDKHNLLRPETIESIFILYQITGKEIYREMGWKMFEAFEKWTRVETGGYSSLMDVTMVPPALRDKMESFFLSETLKYFYLLFSDKVIIPLDQYVINTEAHPLPIFEIKDLELKEKLEWLENK